MELIAFWDISTKYAKEAPRDKDSIPRAPEPAKQSKITLFLKKSLGFLSVPTNTSNNDCLNLSRVGRAESGTVKIKPFNWPDKILMDICETLKKLPKTKFGEYILIKHYRSYIAGVFFSEEATSGVPSSLNF